MSSQNPLVKEVFNTLFYNTDEKLAYLLIEKLENPVDIAFAKIHLLTYLSNFQQNEKVLDLLREVENINETLVNHLLQFWIDLSYCILYMGGLEPGISDKVELKKYYDKLNESIQILEFSNSWEENLTIGMYENFKFWYLVKSELNPENAEPLIKNAIDYFLKIPIDGKYFSYLGQLNLGNFYRLIGKFKEARKIFLELESIFRNYNNKWMFWVLSNLSWLSLLNGNFKNAMNWTKEQLDIAKRYEDTYGIFWSLDQLAYILFQEKYYENSLKIYNESLFYRKKHNDPLTVFWGYYHIFEYHLALYQNTENRERHLKEAESLLVELSRIRETRPENKTMINYCRLAQALILKHGSIRDKAAALDILEDLTEIYPTHIDIMVNLAESLFEDVNLSFNEKTVEKIENLMSKIEQIPLRKNPEATIRYVSQQILISKYNFYLKGDIEKALDILYQAKEKIMTYEIPHLEQLIENEILMFRKKYQKWEGFNEGFKERLKESEFQDYLREALDMIKKDQKT